MCGRYALTTTRQAIIDEFNIGVPTHLDHVPRYNIAPSQPVLIVRPTPKGRELTLVRWGLVPYWEKDLGKARKPINARSETAATNGMFKGALKYRRCLLPATCFYEWRSVEGQKTKCPYLIQPADESTLALAGLWEHWQDADGNELETSTILTTEPNAEMRELHNRMPVIIQPEDRDRWLNASIEDPGDVADLLQPLPDGTLAPMPVSTHVNSVRNDDPVCMKPAPTNGKLW